MAGRLILGGCALLVGVLATADTIAQTYPDRPIRIVTTAPGSGTDFLARLVGQGVSAAVGQQVVVDNRGIVAIDIASKAAADGHTLLLYTSPLWLSPVFRSDVTWNVTRDFVPVIAPTTTPNMLVVHPSMPAKSVKELITYAKANPGKLNYGSGSTAASAHIAAELFKSMAGVDIVRVNFRGTGPAMNALLATEVQMVFPAAGTALPHVRAGRLRSLGVTSSARSPLAPGMPTVASQGLPGYESSSVTGVFAPAGTPAAIVRRLHREMAMVLGTEEVKARLFKSGLEVVAYSPEQFSRFISSEVARMDKMVKAAGLRE